MIGPTVRGMLVLALLAAPMAWAQVGPDPTPPNTALQTTPAPRETPAKTGAAKPVRPQTTPAQAAQTQTLESSVRAWITDGILVILAGITVVFAAAFFRALRSRSGASEISVETHWGGFGGGLGGWRVSLPPPLLLLIAALAFGGMLCMAVAGK